MSDELKPFKPSDDNKLVPDVQSGYVDTSYPVRWVAYKPQAVKQFKGKRGRWQEMNGYGGWENCEPPHQVWSEPKARTDTIPTWQPIESIPDEYKDGRMIDLYANIVGKDKGKRLCDCKWGEYAICGGMVFETGWIGTYHQYEDYELTHWRPLPKPPTP